MKSYDDLLLDFHDNVELTDMLVSVILEDNLERELYFLEHGSYPEKRCLLSKLKMDLKIASDAVKTVNKED